MKAKLLIPLIFLCILSISAAYAEENLLKEQHLYVETHVMAPSNTLYGLLKGSIVLKNIASKPYWILARLKLNGLPKSVFYKQLQPESEVETTLRLDHMVCKVNEGDVINIEVSLVEEVEGLPASNKHVAYTEIYESTVPNLPEPYKKYDIQLQLAKTIGEKPIPQSTTSTSENNVFKDQLAALSSLSSSEAIAAGGGALLLILIILAAVMRK